MNQIPHMLIALLIIPLVSLFHTIIHALLKPLLPLLARPPTHAQPKFQPIYKIKPNHSLIKIIF